MPLGAAAESFDCPCRSGVPKDMLCDSGGKTCPEAGPRPGDEVFLIGAEKFDLKAGVELLLLPCYHILLGGN